MRLRSHPRPALSRVLFAEDFEPADIAAPDAAPATVVAVPDPPTEAPAGLPPDEVARLCAEARAAGEAAGRRDALSALETERSAFLAAIAGACAGAGAEAARVADERAEWLSRAALSVLLGALPAMAERQGEDELRRLLRLVLPGLTAEPYVTLTVSPNQEALARSIVAPILGPHVRIAIATSSRMLAGDVRLTWQDGAASRDLDEVRSRMTERMTELGLLEPTDGDQTHVE